MGGEVEIKEIISPELFVELTREVREPFVAFLPCKPPLTKTELIFDLTRRRGLIKPYLSDEPDIAFNLGSEGIYIHVHKGFADPEPLLDLGIKDVHIHPHPISSVSFVPTTGDIGLRRVSRNLFILAKLGERAILTRFNPLFIIYGGEVEVIFPKEEKSKEKSIKTTLNYPLFTADGWEDREIVGDRVLLDRVDRALDEEGQPILILDTERQRPVATCIPDYLFLELERDYGDDIFTKEDLYQLALKKMWKDKEY